MKKKNLFFRFIISLFILTGFFVSCENINWFSNFMDDLNYLNIPFTFYCDQDGSGSSIEKKYISGKIFSGEQLIQYSESYILQYGNSGSGYPSHAVVHAIKLLTESVPGPEGVTKDASGNIQSIKVTEPLYFKPVIWYKFSIEHQFEDVNDETNFITESKEYFSGEKDSSVDLSDYKLDKNGFEIVSPSDTLIVSDFSLQNGILKYNRKSYNINFNSNGGSFTPSASPVVKKFGYPINQNELPVPSLADYEFIGWDGDIPQTMPAEDITLTAKWKGEPKSISYFLLDRINFAEDVSLIAVNQESLPEVYTPGEETLLPEPKLYFFDSNDNVMVFAGWYLDEDGTEEKKLVIQNGKSIIPDTMTGEIKLYAKFFPKYVYVNTETGTPGTTGFETESPVMTITDAKKLMKDNPYGEEIRILKTLTFTDDINNLSGTYQTDCGYGKDRGEGDGTKGDGVLIVPTAKNQLMIVQNGENVSLTNVVIGRETEISIDDNLLIDVESGATVKLEEGCLIKHITSSINSDTGNGLINILGELNLDEAEITNCKCKNIFNVTSNSSNGGTFIINSGKITNCTGTAVNIEDLRYGYGLTINGGTVTGNTVDINTMYDVNISGYEKIGNFKLSKTGAKIILIRDITSPNQITLSFNPDVAGFLGQRILDNSGSINISTNKSKFTVPSGYAIDDNGKLLKASEVEIDIHNPSSITEYALGEFIDKSVKNSDDAKVRIKINDDAYTNIADWGGYKYVMYQVAGYGYDCFKAKIERDTVNNYYYADLILQKPVKTNDNTTSYILSDSDIGYKEISVFVSTDPEKETTVSVNGISENIFVHK